ncbi:PqqD family protein [bacterium]|nr:PqqD family protein [bacterium]
MGNRLNRMAMNDSGFIFDPNIGVSYTTNSTGLEILKKLKETQDLDEIKAKIMDEFEVSEIEAERDIVDFMELLKSKGIIS